MVCSTTGQKHGVQYEQHAQNDAHFSDKKAGLTAKYPREKSLDNYFYGDQYSQLIHKKQLTTYSCYRFFSRR